MDIESYLTMKCVYEKRIPEDAEFMTEEFAAAREIACFRYGDRINLLTSDTVDRLSAQTYLVVEDVKPGDKIDGQLVSVVNDVPDFDGSNQLHEVHVSAQV